MDRGLTPGAPTESPAPETEGTGDLAVLVHKARSASHCPQRRRRRGAGRADGDRRDPIADVRRQEVPATKKYPFTAKFDVHEASQVRVARVAFVPDTVSAGSAATVEIELSIGTGWHLYAQKQVMEAPPKFTWTLSAG